MAGGPSLLPDLAGAIARHFQARGLIVEGIAPRPSRPPAEALSAAFGVPAEAGTLAREGRLADHLAVVDTDLLDAVASNG